MKHAVSALRRGEPVLVYDSDDREGEVDVVYAAEHVEPADVARLRNDAGGLICVAVHPEAAERLGLPFQHDILPAELVEAELDYDVRSSFSLWLNHRSTRTGITDRDRATTISALAEAVSRSMADVDVALASEFRAPGHVAVLRADEHLLQGRRGHTEMAVELAMEAGLTPAAVVCEMLDDDTGEALSLDDARIYARQNDLVVLEGDDLVEAVSRSRGAHADGRT
ncbi:MAG: 3,4-dihydroxy-2-butanone-4-phosphate synthase [Halobacteriota archaeon]